MKYTMNIDRNPTRNKPIVVWLERKELLRQHMEKFNYLSYINTKIDWLVRYLIG